MQLLDYQKYVFMRSWHTPFVLWCMGRSSGKALSLDTEIPTPTGFTTMRELKVGDCVLDENGCPTKVNYVSDIFLGNDCYEITFNDGEKIIADADHIWHTRTRKSKCYSNKLTKEMYKDYKINRPDGRTENRYRIPKAQSIKYEEKDLTIHPYLLGYWLGDGNSADTRITCSYEDIDEIMNYINECGYSTTMFEVKERAPYFNVGVIPRSQENIFKSGLLSLNLINNKHIPTEYIYSSVNQRIELIRGLMDSDGTVSKDGYCEFTQTNFEIINQFSQILSSLGVSNKITNKKAKLNGNTFDTYKVHFSVDRENNCFKLKRKHNKLRDKLNRRIDSKTIFSIKKVNSVATKCISVDNPTNLFLCGKKFTVTHNTTLGSPFIMAKSILIPNFQAYILAGVGSQSQEMFLKIEKIAKREIASFTGLTDVFYNETVKSAANTDGFTHNPASFQYKVYNGAIVNSLNGSFDNNRSKRSNLNFYDESGFAQDELFQTSEPFAVQNSDFRLGGDVDVTLFPKQMPNQLIYASSASSTDTYFYRKYKDFAKKMFLGDKRYFVADINSDVVINATYNGKLYPVSLLSQETVDAAMRENKEKAMREYKNIFTTEGSDDQIIKRAMIVRNSELRPPSLTNESNNKYIFAIDPARNHDNSVCTIAELIKDDEIGYRLKIVNNVSWTDLERKKKTPIKTPDQIKDFKRMLIEYNGVKSADYENIGAVLIDAGAGGAGMSAWADGLLEDWKDTNGRSHRGLIDISHDEYKNYISQYHNASDIVKLISPQKYKREMFEALIEMMNLNLISFTESYDHKGVLTMSLGNGDVKVHKLTDEEITSLINIDLAKEELVNIYKFKSSNGNVRYDLATEKKNKFGDDRAYTIAMLAWYLQQLRREKIINKHQKEIDLSTFPTQVSTLNINL